MDRFTSFLNYCFCPNFLDSYTIAMDRLVLKYISDLDDDKIEQFNPVGKVSLVK